MQSLVSLRRTKSEYPIIEQEIPIYSILQKLPQNRTISELNRLLQYLKECNFFTKVMLEQSTETIFELLRLLQYEKFTQDQTVFQFGKKGTKFYVVLEGSVKLFAPRTLEKDLGLEDDDEEAQIKTMVEIMTVKAGESFGELAILNNEFRAATAVTQTECHFAVLSRADYEKVLLSKEQEAMEIKISNLLKMPMFRQWARKTLAKLSYYFKELNFIRRQNVFVEGKLDYYIYFVVEGEFKIHKKNRLSGANGQIDLVILLPGELFGDEDELKNYTATCITHTGKLIYISRENFFRRVKSSKKNPIWQAYKRQRRSRIDWRCQREITINNAEKTKTSFSPKLDLMQTNINLSAKVQNFVRGVDKYLQFANKSPMSKNQKNILRITQQKTMANLHVDRTIDTKIREHRSFATELSTTPHYVIPKRPRSITPTSFCVSRTAVSSQSRGVINSYAQKCTSLKHEANKFNEEKKAHGFMFSSRHRENLARNVLVSNGN